MLLIATVFISCGSETGKNISGKEKTARSTVPFKNIVIHNSEGVFIFDLPGLFTVQDTNSSSGTMKGDAYVETNVLARLLTKTNYDFSIDVLSKPVTAKQLYGARVAWNNESEKPALTVVEEKENYIIYKGIEGDGTIPYFSVIVVQKAGGRYLVTDTEQVHFEEGKAIVLTREECSAIVDLYATIKLLD